MHLLVTGGAGFIGSNFTSLALARGARVTVLDALTYASGKQFVEADMSLYPNMCRLVVDSILNRETVYDLVREVDAVVHFAAESHNDNSLQDPLSFVRTNVEGTAILLEAAREFNVRLHHVSTDEVYGDLPLNADQKFTENSPYRPSSPYSASKAAADHLVRAWVRSFGLPATISNSSNNFGPRQHVEKLIPRTITERLLGRCPRVYGTGQNVRDWIHVDDHNEAVWRILQSGQMGRTYLIGGEQQRSNLEVVRYINFLMGAERDDLEFVVDRPGHDRRYALDAQRIREELGWRPARLRFEDELAKTIHWYEQNRSWWEPMKTATEQRLSKHGY
ncbi:dTDP-glucose 4,6-dehydratase [Gleimia europaea]|uniref:dTDP-glucose 4,6-dehydratase n=1 Tax=Gleimia europaea ACS-120-V-Col10b TaxID=883069 RepID=A0A9W5RD01_9ACTO|nr:dTDP-glucose 4,6-dehydratase [Gleimia europaea]EPD29412.1 dTDP-glucose 4,6-dehydratase [Gleimia europaea ACS-120-V-Col10b]